MAIGSNVDARAADSSRTVLDTDLPLGKYLALRTEVTKPPAARRSALRPIRKRSRVTADRAVAAVEELLNEGGCAVNELVKNDYGFDLHVQLPDHLPEETEDEWPMSPHSVLVQVKGGSYVSSGIRLDVDRWQYLLSSMAPVYLAAVPSATSKWIASVEELLPHGVTYIETATYSAAPRRASWSSKGFVTDALLASKLGNPRVRRWWRSMQPQVTVDEDPDPSEFREAGYELLIYILDLAILSLITSDTMEVDDFQRCADKAEDMIVSHHRLVAALEEVRLVHDAWGGRREVAVDLLVQVPESQFLEQTGRPTPEGIEGSNFLHSLSESVSLTELALPAIDRFLESMERYEDPGADYYDGYWYS
jgi:hypothetical protein